MRRTMVGTLLAVLTVGGTLTGAGSTFIYPLLSAWAHRYHQETGVRINYQSIGSGGGVRQIINRTVDFGASDAPMSPEDVEKHRLLQFPVAIGGVVIAYNLPGVAKLNLPADVLCDIFRGVIQRWDDPRIAQANPEIALPSLPIRVIHRSDGSGTTWIFTHFLSQSCPAWKETVGYGKAVKWPAGIGGKGNEGVANYLRRLRGGIGYLEYAYALQNRLPVARVENRAGNMVAPSIEAFQEAARHARWDASTHFYEVLTWEEGEHAYPITGATFILLARDGKRNAEVVAFLDWGFRKGDSTARVLHYVPLPEEVKEAIRAYWRTHGLRDGN